MLRNHTVAPDFSLLDHSGQTRSLHDLRAGGLALIVFFRGEFCPTSRAGLVGFGNIYGRLQDLKCALVAISVDTVDALARQRERLELGFTLLSDPEFVISEKYGVYCSDDGEGPQPHGEPAVFILDVGGNIAYSQVQTGPRGQASPAEMVLIAMYMAAHGGRYE